MQPDTNDSQEARKSGSQRVCSRWFPQLHEDYCVYEGEAAGEALVLTEQGLSMRLESPSSGPGRAGQDGLSLAYSKPVAGSGFHKPGRLRRLGVRKQ